MSSGLHVNYPLFFSGFSGTSIFSIIFFLSLHRASLYHQSSSFTNRCTFIILENSKIYIKTYIKIAPTCFGLRPSSGRLQLSLAKVPLMSKQSAKLRRYVLCGGVAACYVQVWCVCCVCVCVYCVLCFAYGFVMHLLWLAASTISSIPILLAASQRRCMINTIGCIHSKIPPDDE
jgi:hypothetical protein